MGRATATPNPAPRRSRVEQEILRCAANGEAADFTGPQWKRVKRVDGRVVVSGKFLADLWLGLTDCRVHPVGIALKGVHIEGVLALGGARVDARMRTPLVGFMAEQCRFEAELNLGNARVESLYFTDCIFGATDGIWASLFANSVEVIGQFHFTRCQFEGYCSLRNAVIDDDLKFAGCTLAKGLMASGSEIRGNLSISASTSHGFGEATIIAVELFDMDVAGNVELVRCRLGGAIAASQIRASSLRLEKVVAPGPSGLLNATFSRIAHNVRVVQCRMEGGADLSCASIGGQLSFFRSILGRPASDNRVFRIPSARIAMAMLIDRCRIYGGILANNLDAGQLLRLSGASLVAPSPNLIIADFSSLTAIKVEISDCFAAGQMRFDNAALVRFTLDDSTIDMTGRRRRRAPCSDVESTTFGLTLYAARIEQDLIISASTPGRAVHIDGGLSLQALKAGGQVVVRFCWLGREGMDHSLQAWGMKSAGLIEVSNCVLPSGLYAPNLETADLRLKHLVVTAPLKGPGHYVAVSLETARISDACFIGSDDPDHSLMMQMTGSLFAGDSEIANMITISGLTMRLPDTHAPEVWSGGASFAGAKLGDFHIGRDDAMPATVLAGCVAFDRASIRSLRLYRSASVRVRNKDAGRMFADSESDAVLRCKWGVAVSLVAVTVERALFIDRSRLDGMVDCKNLSVNTLVDKGGEAWLQAGVAPGQLRLDGMTYSDLDDDQITSIETRPEGGSTAKPRGAVARRLDWLAMQYPDGEADASSFTPQPYEQLARHYASLGDERARRQVLVRKRQLQRTHSGLGWIERTVSGLLGLTSDYGYSPGKASIASALVIAFGALAAWALHSAGAIVPASDEAGSALFSPLLFALDVAVPFLDLGHDSLWRIDPAALPAWPGRTLTVGLAEALYRLAGLVMLSITVLTFSGILHEKE